MMMWLMSDRALPRSYRTMEGFGVHTFRLVNSRGEGTFVKFPLRDALTERGAIVEIVAPRGGALEGGAGGELPVDRTIDTTASVLYDAVVAPCGDKSVETLAQDGRAVGFVTEAYKHSKPIAAFGSGPELLRAAGITFEFATSTTPSVTDGVVTTKAAAGDVDAAFCADFANEIAHHRAWQRRTAAVPA